ncbi:MAG TPA: hypothetical protein VGH54_28230 [Mycobacterium sp.]|jgi:hypothetical protein|uniref:hypothetical protein n=1 Tax=Mycobacterium sp. TaxID=1785 RepID=UPI002F421244
MARVKLELGAELDMLTKPELDESLTEAAKLVREQVRGVKYRRLPQLAGIASGGVLDIGGDANAGGTSWNGQPVGPDQGWAWEIRLLGVAGLTTGATPDIVNIYIRGAGSALPWWQLNGNNFSYTFGKGALVLLPGETLRMASTGTFAATGTVTLFGSATQLPAEQLGKLLM